MRSTTKIGWLVLALGLLSGCGPTGQTGAGEESELYNSAGLIGQSLFDAEGMAPPALTATPIVRAGLMWDAEPGTTLEGRVLGEDQLWGPWTPIVAYWEEDLAHAGNLDVPSGFAVGIQLRLSNGAAPLHVVAEGFERIGEYGSEEPAQDLDLPPPQEGTFGELQQALAPSSLVHPRSDWGARAPRCSSSSHTPVKATIHHTATALPDSMTPKARLREIQAYHMYSAGYCDIGYHVLVDWNGAAWQGRNEKVVGAHTKDHNTGNVGISFMGTYTNRSATSAQITKGAKILRWLHTAYGIALNRDRIKGHRQYNATACPGDKLYSQLNGMVEQARNGTPAKGTLRGVIYRDNGAGAADTSERIPGAKVKVVGVGTKTAAPDTAAWAFKLAPKTYTVTASAAGHKSASRTCKVVSSKTTKCSIGLKRLPGKIRGIVYEDLGAGEADTSHLLGGATVKLSGQGSVIAAAEDASWSKSVPPGTYTVTAILAGYTTGSRSCQVQSGKEVWCSIGLIKDGTDVPDDPDPALTGGKLHGFVLALDPAGGGQDPQSGVPNAVVSADSGESTNADAFGYFELQVPQGDHTLHAAADGFTDGEAQCAVTEGGEAECTIVLVRQDGSDQTDDQEPVEDPEGQLDGGCSTAAGAGRLPAALLLLMIGAALHLRRRV
jgi:MYXO-CTERM domain-containing protein